MIDSLDIQDLFNLKNALRLLIFVIMFGYVFYSFLIMMRVRILVQTFKTENSGFVSSLSKIHFFMVLIGSIIVALLILV